MLKLITNRRLAFINFGIVCYFFLIWLIHFYQIDFFIIGFFQELFTIPFLIAQFIFLFISIAFLIKNPKKYLSLISLMALAVCTFLTTKSFF
jgi:hypothetical protein